MVSGAALSARLARRSERPDASAGENLEQADLNLAKIADRVAGKT